MDEENGDLPVSQEDSTSDVGTAQSGRIEEAKKRAADLVKKNLKNNSLLKALGPILIKIGLVVLVLLIIIGIAMFLISMPGMVMEQLKDLARKVGNSIADFFGGDTTDNISDQQVYDVMDYLEEMNFDLKGDGFLTDYLTEADNPGNLTFDDKQGVFRDDDRKIGKAESDFITTYLMSDNYVYTIANDNLTTIDGDDNYEGFFGFFRRIGAALKGLWAKASNLIFNDGYKWGRGLIEIYYDDGLGVQGEYFGSSVADDVFGWNGVKILVDKNPPVMEIRRGWLSNPMRYNLDGWTGRYGMPVDFLIAVHHATLMPDLAYDMIKTFDTKVTILLHDVQGAAIAAYQGDNGRYITYEEMSEIADEFEILGTAQRIHLGPFDSFTDSEAKKLMRLLGLKSPDNCENVQHWVSDDTNNDLTDDYVSESSGDTDNAATRYNGMIQDMKNHGCEDVGLPEEVSGEEIAGLCTDDFTVINDEEMNNYGYSYFAIGDHTYMVRKTEIAKKKEINKTWTGTVDDSACEYTLKATITYIKGDLLLSNNGFVDHASSLDDYVSNHSELSKDEAIDEYFRISYGTDREICYISYKIVRGYTQEELDANGGVPPKCSDIDDEETICGVCKAMVFDVLKRASKADVSNYKSYQPYISKVTNHWYRDVYFFDDVNNFVDYDYDYQAVTKERWTLYETYKPADNVPEKIGEYKLYRIDKNGNYGALFNGTQEEANQKGISVAKKAVTTADFEDLGWNNINTEDNPRWSAYKIDDKTSTSDFEQLVNEDGSSLQDDYGEDINEIYVQTKFDGTIVQTGEGLRRETNNDIKRMFLNNKYFQYKGDTETAEVITELRKSVTQSTGKDVNYYGPIKGTRKNGQDANGNNTYADVDYSDVTVTIDGQTHKASDYISKVSLEQDFLNACTMLENIHTLDADFITRDFKELAVELGYFGKEELTDETPRLMEFPVPEIGSFGYPKRIIDKNENEYGTMIHSKGDIDVVNNIVFDAFLSSFEDNPGEAEPSTNPEEQEDENEPEDTPEGEIASTGNRNLSQTVGKAEGGTGELKDPEDVSREEFLEAAEEVHSKLEQYKMEYCQGTEGSHNSDNPHHDGGGHARYNTVEDSINGLHRVDCSAYVSWVLQAVGLLKDVTYTGEAGTDNGLYGLFKEYIITKEEAGELQPGDIALSDTHTQIMGEENTQWNAGNGEDIRNKPQPNSWQWNSYTHVIRFPFNQSKNKGEEYKGYNGNEAVVSPVTGILLEYGTYDDEKDSVSDEEYRTNVDYKYDTTANVYKDKGANDERPDKDKKMKTPVDKVGYAKIYVLDSESYMQLEKSFKDSISTLRDYEGPYETYPSEFGDTPDSLINPNGTYNDYLKREDQLEPDEEIGYEGWSDRQKTIYGYKEFVENYERAGIGGYIVYIDGFICEEPGTMSNGEGEQSEGSGDQANHSDYIPEGNKEITLDTFREITSGSFDGAGNIGEDAEKPLSGYEKDDEYNMASKRATDKINAESKVKDEALPTYKTDGNIKIDLRKLKNSNLNVNNNNDDNNLEVDAISGAAPMYESVEGLFIKEGTVLGRTMTDKELLETDIRKPSTETYDGIRGTENDKIIGNYIRMMIRDVNGEMVENVEDYLKLDDGEDDKKEPVEFEQFAYYLGCLLEGFYADEDKGDSYGVEVLNDGAGNTTAFGLTKAVGELPKVQELYPDFVNHLGDGLVPKEEAQDVFILVLESAKEHIEESVTTSNLDENYLYALMDLSHASPTECEKVIGILNANGVLTVEDFENHWGTNENYGVLLRTRGHNRGILATEGRFLLYQEGSSGDEVIFDTETPWTEFCEGGGTFELTREESGFYHIIKNADSGYTPH